MKGSCLCKQIQFSVVRFKPDQVGNCFCSMCRKFHGAAYATYGSVAVEDFSWVCGEGVLKIFTSSEKAERGFCGNCGSSIFYRLRKPDADYEIALGVLDDEPGLTASTNIWCASKAKWATSVVHLPSFDESRKS